MAGRRRFARQPVQNGPSIGLKRLRPDGHWSPETVMADVLDVSIGGLCVLIADGRDFQPGDRLELQLDDHPGFGVARLTARIRWMRCSDLAGVCVTGVAFDAPLRALPRLS